MFARSKATRPSGSDKTKKIDIDKEVSLLQRASHDILTAAEERLAETRRAREVVEDAITRSDKLVPR